MYNSLHSATVVASTLRLNKHFDTSETASSIYTGRHGHLEGLKQVFDKFYSFSGNSLIQKRFVVVDLGGFGKTHNSLRITSKGTLSRLRYILIGVSSVFGFWIVDTVDASSQGIAQQSFIAIAKAYVTGPNERAAKSWLSSIDRPWLLILDSDDHPYLDVEKYFLDGDYGLTLITTRNPSVKMHGTIGRRFYHFDRLDDDEASELLLRAAEQDELGQLRRCS